MAKFKKGHKKIGGKKKGSKHKKTIEQELTLGFLRKQIMKKWRPLIDAKIRLALGIYVQRKIVLGKGHKKTELVRVYKKPPDSASIEYLISMVVGKPKEEDAPPTSVTINLISKNVEAAKKRVANKKKSDKDRLFLKSN